MTAVLLYASHQRQDHVFFIRHRRWRRELIVERQGDGKTEMQENILLLKGVEMLLLADQRAEGMDWCQAAAMRGFPDFCVMLHTHTHIQSSFFFSPCFILSMNTLHSLGKNPSLSCRSKQAPTQRALPIITLLSLCSHCCPWAPGRGSSYGTNTFIQTLPVRSWKQHGELASWAGITILRAEVTTGKHGYYLHLLIPLNSSFYCFQPIIRSAEICFFAVPY